MPYAIERRALLRTGGVAVLATAAATACDTLSTKPKGERRGPAGGGGGGPKQQKPQEAPMLAGQVAKGKLPALKKRLPAKPLVVQPNTAIGAYGGQLRIRLGDSVPLGVQRMYFVAGYDNLVSWDVKFKEAVPNLAQSFSVNDAGTEWTFHLREGVKWSDGEPFTAADVVFAVNDVLMNTDLNPAPPEWLGEATATAEGDYVVRLTLKVPNGLLAQQIATQDGSSLTTSPQHFMKKYHKKYNPSIDDVVKQEKFNNWMNLYASHVAFSDGHASYRTPTLTAWRYTTAVDATPDVVLERNPYYWKVDPQGSQLPYADRLSFTRTNDQASVLKVSNGDFDFVMTIQPPADKPVYARNRSQGHYHFTPEHTEYMNDAVLHFNLTHQDPAKRAVFRNLDFRIGLSHAINRAEVIDAVFQRQGSPWQIAPRKESRYYDEEMATQYAEYDVAKANQHLDRAFPKKNSDGIRLGPDGKPISFKFNIGIGGDSPPGAVDTLQLLVNYWRKVGVDVTVNSMSRELMISTAEANRHDATVWTGEGGLDAIIELNPYNYIPILEPWSFYAVEWGRWYTSGGKQGEKPPPVVVRQLQMYDKFKASTDEAERVGLMKEILRAAKKNFFVIGVEAPGTSYHTLTDRTKNWPSFTSQGDWVYSSPGPTNPCQYYIGKA